MRADSAEKNSEELDYSYGRGNIKLPLNASSLSDFFVKFWALNDPEGKLSYYPEGIISSQRIAIAPQAGKPCTFIETMSYPRGSIYGFGTIAGINNTTEEPKGDVHHILVTPDSPQNLSVFAQVSDEGEVGAGLEQILDLLSQPDEPTK